MQARGVTLQWRRLTYRVTVGFGKRRRSKTVLLDASGCVRPGHLLAVLGGTGGHRPYRFKRLPGTPACILPGVEWGSLDAR